MNYPRAIPSILIAITLLCGSVAAADPLGTSRVAETDAPAFYAFQGEHFGVLTEVVHARFEYRIEKRIIHTERFVIRIAETDTVLVAIPHPNSVVPQGGDRSTIEFVVFVEDLLVNAFDLESLASYDAGLRNRFADELAALVPNADLRGPAYSRGFQKVDCPECGPPTDWDNDGVLNADDNCMGDYNPEQTDCDGDGMGDVCDPTDGIYTAIGSVYTCWTDKDNHILYETWEHHVEQRYRDVSSCGSPDTYDDWVRSDGQCYLGYGTDEYCCNESIGTSIEQVGDNADYWCGDGIRNIDFCH